MMTGSTEKTIRIGMSSEKQIKKLKKILKDKGLGPLTLKDACSKFNQMIGIEDESDCTLFLQRLWDLKRKTKVSR